MKSNPKDKGFMFLLHIDGKNDFKEIKANDGRQLSGWNTFLAHKKPFV